MRVWEIPIKGNNQRNWFALDFVEPCSLIVTEAIYRGKKLYPEQVTLDLSQAIRNAQESGKRHYVMCTTDYQLQIVCRDDLAPVYHARLAFVDPNGDVSYMRCIDEASIVTQMDTPQPPNTRRFFKSTTKTVRQVVPVMEERRVFNEKTGKWETVVQQKMSTRKEKRYRLERPELGEESPILEEFIDIEEPAFEEVDVPVEEMVEVEVPISAGTSGF
ncbi:MAG: hypothetical protein DRI39_10375 [Chloroflexi bacterium]|nr:MAG: hypothetical protein DRI39_10375 [Chloroflexota bacterium]